MTEPFTIFRSDEQEAKRIATSLNEPHSHIYEEFLYWDNQAFLKQIGLAD